MFNHKAITVTRKKLGWTIGDLSARTLLKTGVRIPYSTLFRYEVDIVPSAVKCFAICDTLGLEMGELVKLEGLKNG